MSPRDRLLAAGSTFAGLRVARVLARGATGVLYLAVDADSRALALKVLTPHTAGDDDATALAERFAREAEVLRRLRHPAIVEVHAAGVEQQRAYLAMTLLPGGDLRRHARAARLLPEALVLRLGAEVADALAHAHAQGVVHRDLKPANLVFDAASRRVWVTDFGVARMLDAHRTRSGVLLGTPAFMPPEQLAGAAAGPAGDVYALGVTLFQLLSGELPHDGATLGALLQAVARGAPRSLGKLRPDLPAALAAFVAELTHPDPASRPGATAAAERLASLQALVR
ncbi:serine/threonine-protein kinase [Azohydromonas sp.]|uniref:serine/threonine-protein kinase n=1 Tax=Azohydromonas sp. TaxID=1872666 RepID=UPI002BED9819|nr:serine/threonine-protein kinase [Azohydromonas sp.]HMM84950.1 serine/threonine-protein kinase [Azohydromonas sp.]